MARSKIRGSGRPKHPRRSKPSKKTPLPSPPLPQPPNPRTAKVAALRARRFQARFARQGHGPCTPTSSLRLRRGDAARAISGATLRAPCVSGERRRGGGAGEWRDTGRRGGTGEWREVRPMEERRSPVEVTGLFCESGGEGAGKQGKACILKALRKSAGARREK